MKEEANTCFVLWSKGDYIDDGFEIIKVSLYREVLERYIKRSFPKAEKETEDSYVEKIKDSWAEEMNYIIEEVELI